MFRAREKKTGARRSRSRCSSPTRTRSDATRAAFMAEARLLEKLEHPGLVKGFGVAQERRRRTSRKLECIEGRTLLEMLDGRPARSTRTVALRVVLEVAEVLAYLAEPGRRPPRRQAGQHHARPERAREADRPRLRGARREARADRASDSDGRHGRLPLARAGARRRGGRRAQRHLQPGRDALPPRGRAAAVRELATTARCCACRSCSRSRSPELKSRGLSPHLHYFIEKMMAKEAELRYQSLDGADRRHPRADRGPRAASTSSATRAREAPPAARRKF